MLPDFVCMYRNLGLYFESLVQLGITLSPWLNQGLYFKSHYFESLGELRTQSKVPSQLQDFSIFGYKPLKIMEMYRIAGFVCEVLICANYARCCGLLHFNSTVTFNSAIVLGLSQLCALLYLM